MTYTFKLSRRLAVLSLLAAAAACGASDAPLGPDSTTDLPNVTQPEPRDSSTVTPPPPPGAPGLARLDLRPGVDTLWYGDTLDLVAVGYSTAGDSGLVHVSWSATGGTVTASGTYVAGTAQGDHIVVARHAGGIADTARIRIVPAIAEVVVRPDSVDLAPGQSQQFTAVGVSTLGDTVAVAVVWSATGGTITAGGLFTAGSEGSYQVFATLLGPIVTPMPGATGRAASAADAGRVAVGRVAGSRRAASVRGAAGGAIE